MTGRIRVLRVITRLNVGGPSRHVVQLARLPADRFEQMVVAGAVEADERELPEAATIERRSIDALRRSPSPLNDLRALGALRALAKSFRPHVVHSHQAKAGALARVAVRLGAAARVHTYHGHTFSGYWGGGGARAVLATERFLARRSEALIAQSPSQRDEIATFLGRAASSRLRTIAPGVDFAALGAHERPVEPAPGSPLVLGLLGRLAPVKDADLFLEAVAALVRGGADVLARVGGGGDALVLARLQARASELGIAERVRFEGWIDEPATFLRAIDVLVLTSRNEGTPLVLLEALWCGCAVAAVPVGGVADVVAGFASAVVARDRGPEAIARAAATAAARRPDELGLSTTRAELERRFGTERLLVEMARLYEELVDPAGPG